MHITSVKSINKSTQQELSDAHIFEPARSIIEGLENRRCTEAIEWCAANSGRLTKLRSALPFQLRRQEFVELVRQGKRADAIVYARQHLARWAATQMEEIRKVAGLLAFSEPGARCASHAAMLADTRWRELVEMFRQELYKLHALPPVSLITMHVQSGLAALNATLPGDAPRSRADPLRLPTFATLATVLPRAKHSNSQLICAMSHEIMDEDNAPLVLPNGYVYGERALRQQAALDDGHVTCLVTGKGEG